MYQNQPRKFRIQSIQIILYAPGSPMAKKHLEIYVEEYNDPNKRMNPQHLRFGADQCFATKEELKKHIFKE